MNKKYNTDEERIAAIKLNNIKSQKKRKDKIKEYNKLNRDIRIEYEKKYLKKNKDKIKEYQKKYYLENKEKRKKYTKNNKEYHKTYRIKNKEKLKLKNKKYYENNKDKIKEYHKKRNIEKKDEINIVAGIYSKNRYKEDILYKLIKNIRTRIGESFRVNNFTKKSKTYNILGCSFDEFKLYLESKFEVWMNWDNRGLYNGELNYGWDLDHIIPISSATTEEDIIRLNHYTNFQPLCSYTNRYIKKDI